jgi:hypothetical protein
MLTRIVTSLPMGPLDAWFARGLSALAPRITGRACEVCRQTFACGTCQCPQGFCGSRQCDGCGTGECYCYCPPPPLC